MPADLHQNSNQQRLLTVQQAADILNVSGKTLRRWDQNGKLIARRTKGGQRRYHEDNLLKFGKKPVVSHLPLPPTTSISKKTLDFPFFRLAGALSFLFLLLAGFVFFTKQGKTIQQGAIRKLAEVLFYL